ncbi:dienelactone hydrolase family protein [Uliginosibacterium sp. sgz301328]|uniref:dienelactone hydrolase family protein n=1 Tax=Uliginosibacterium sp. sgz301328 TaxID=3243764 RepID=UPI00359E73E1
MRVARLMTAFALAVCVSGASAATMAPVEIPPGELSSSSAPLKAFLFTPDTKGPHPAVVMMHGCGGAYAGDGALNARHAMWGEYLASLGYVALMVDSFTSRGVKELCTIPLAQRPLKEADRTGDAYAAQAWLRGRADVDTAHIAVLGWSHGGGVVLDTVARLPKGAKDKGVMPFAAAVAFYPGCSARARRADRFHPNAPLLVLIGEADDWTPAAPCVSLAETLAARGEPMQVVTYPDTYHDFDNPGIKRKRVRSDVPNGVHPGQGVTTAPNPAAREDARQRVATYFAAHLKAKAPQ